APLPVGDCWVYLQIPAEQVLFLFLFFVVVVISFNPVGFHSFSPTNISRAPWWRAPWWRWMVGRGGDHHGGGGGAGGHHFQCRIQKPVQSKLSFFFLQLLLCHSWQRVQLAGSDL
ncbi:unnamed protein product, partial [Polarella glacialis]